jgi:hypothetical protein
MQKKSRRFLYVKDCKARYLCGCAAIILLICLGHAHALNAIEEGLWAAVLDGDEERVQQMLAQGADVNATNDYGTTALILAAKKGHTKIVKLLLEKGADVRFTERNGYTALRWAEEKGHKDIVPLLRANQADVVTPREGTEPEDTSEPAAKIQSGGSVERKAEIVPKGKIELKNIPPLYTEPKLPGEGIWQWKDMPRGSNGLPVIYRTVYRPSSRFPNAIVYILLFDMRHVCMRLYLGSSEHKRGECPSRVDRSEQPFLLAITNGLWQTRHAGRGGIVCRGKILKKPAKGVASIVLFKDGTVDILEWNDNVPVSQVRDARQLKHLIAKGGKVVTSIMKRGREVHAEIGLGSLLKEDRPVLRRPASRDSKKSEKSPKTKWVLNLTSGPLWFIATRSAFGIRRDGNLVYALGRHISTKDLAKALVLAGCVRAIHGDANPGNAVGILYYTDEDGRIVKKARLSPLQARSTLTRYLDRAYPKDFFGFFRRGDNGDTVDPIGAFPE